MKKWKCLVCGYIHTGDEPPEKCPVCGAPKSQFIEVTEPKAPAPSRSHRNPTSGGFTEIIRTGGSSQNGSTRGRFHDSRILATAGCSK